MLRLLAAQTTGEKVIDVFINAVGTPGGVLALGIFCVMVIGALTRPNVKWFLLAFLLWVCTLAFPNINDVNSNRLLPVFTQLRELNRGVVGLLLITLVFAYSAPKPIWRLKTLSVAGAIFFAYQMLFAGRMIGAADSTRGIVAAGIFLLSFSVLCWRMGQWLVDWNDVDALIRALAGGGVILVLGILPHVILTRSQVVQSSRLVGTTANPQHLAMHLATAIVPCCYLLFRPNEKKWIRLLLLPVVALMIGFLLWTGSRTGFLMSAVGLVLLFRKSLGRFFFAGVFIVLAIYVSLVLFPDSTMAAMRVTDTENTRASAWNGLWADFMRSPLAGNMTSDFNGVGESSYLATAALLGIVGLVPLVGFLIAMGATLFKLMRRRKALGNHALLADMVIAGLASILAGALFEAYFLAVISFEIFVFYAYFSLATFLIDAAEQGEVEALGHGRFPQPLHALEHDEEFVGHGYPPEFIL